MPYYQTTFRRSCFTFGGETKQTFDVVFFCDDKVKEFYLKVSQVFGRKGYKHIHSVAE